MFASVIAAAAAATQRHRAHRAHFFAFLPFRSFQRCIELKKSKSKQQIKLQTTIDIALYHVCIILAVHDEERKEKKGERNEFPI